LHLVWSVVLGASGCSALSDFDGYTFADSVDAGDDGDSAADARPTDDGSADAADARPADDGSVDASADGDASDAGDAGDAGDAAIDAPTRIPIGIIQSAGGAVIFTSDYQLRISIGAPQPMGRRNDGVWDLVVGPGSL
jgi:hypothetical protein